MTQRILLLSCLFAMLSLHAAELPPRPTPQPLPMQGTQWELDDAHFHGCLHNAFEGQPLEHDNGGWRSGPQGIQRTKGVLTGQGTGHATMELRFHLDAAPTGPSTLRITGLNDRHAQTHPLRVELNGQPLADAITFPHNRAPELKLNQRYYLGWEAREVPVPANLLQAGDNRLTITNTTDAFAADTWPFVLIDTVTWSFPAAVSGTVHPPAGPIFYYGMREGVETHIWPTVAYNDRVALLVGDTLEFNIFATMPKEAPLGTAGSLVDEPTRPDRQILMHLWASTPLTVLTIDGTPVQGQPLDGGHLYVRPIDRLIHYQTPHPSQGVRLFIAAPEAFDNEQLRAWYTVDGVAYRSTDYPLIARDLQPVENRQQLDFQLSLWGGNVPDDPQAIQRYTHMLKSAGFDQTFTGNSPELNAQLSQAGFAVHPRYGWFGHGFNVDEETIQYAAYNPKGEPLTRDYCPLAILHNPDHPRLGKYFARARDFASLENIDGLCVDYECAPVWCWCDNCLALFREESGHTDATRADTAPEGPLADAYRDFGRRRNRDLLAHVKAIMQEVNPRLEYLALASASDLPAYWYDPRRARHSIRQLTTFADAIYASHYCYEVPGGMKAVIPTVQTVRRFAVQSGRAVEARLIAPIAQTVSEYPRYRQASMRPDMTRLMVLLTALGGGKGISFFRGDCLDADQYAAIRQAVEELIALQPYLQAGLDRSQELAIQPDGEVNLRFETELAQNLLSRFVWRPQIQYYYDHVQLMADDSGRDRLVALFNYSNATLPLSLRFTGLYDDSFAFSDALTGERVGETVTRGQLERGELTLPVPPRSVRLLRLTTTD